MNTSIKQLNKNYFVRLFLGRRLFIPMLLGNLRPSPLAQLCIVNQFIDVVGHPLIVLGIFSSPMFSSVIA